jgi:hypothetical protein
MNDGASSEFQQVPRVRAIALSVEGKGKALTLSGVDQEDECK